MEPDWIEHRRGRDGELVGWMEPDGDGFVVIDLLGHARTGPVGWFEAEETLDALGIGYLADPYELLLESGEWLRVRITEVSTASVGLKKDDFGDMTADQLFYTVEFPVPQEKLRPRRG